VEVCLLAIFQSGSYAPTTKLAAAEEEVGCLVEKVCGTPVHIEFDGHGSRAESSTICTSYVVLCIYIIVWIGVGSRPAIERFVSMLSVSSRAQSRGFQPCGHYELFTEHWAGQSIQLGHSPAHTGHRQQSHSG